MGLTVLTRLNALIDVESSDVVVDAGQFPCAFLDSPVDLVSNKIATIRDHYKESSRPAETKGVSELRCIESRSRCGDHVINDKVGLFALSVVDSLYLDATDAIAAELHCLGQLQKSLFDLEDLLFVGCYDENCERLA